MAYTWPVHCLSTKRSLPDYFAIGLLRKSQWLRNFPDPPVGRPSKDDPIFMENHHLPLANCDGFGYAKDFYPVKILKPVPWVQSIILQEVRDLPAKKYKFRSNTWPWLCILQEFHRDSARSLPPELFSPRLLPQPLATIYDRLTIVDQQEDCQRELKALLYLLWEDMRAKGTLMDPILSGVDPDFEGELEYQKQMRGLSGEEIDARSRRVE
ncbi:hypothetical protein BO94DRAFT_538347 [Aspergillus sclerotioniger CBS 115572]|uniref:Uncharacterized protein n=1 Tax=Aspergillus sclerotioniger CBS 115572 TaxID=1450535 RepID=A0A317VT30_9EURO|nr:hypothetical protein BO94DRAFT_538347 [Aspergillus sclerotioniger CBS 115572]PWY76471.1 hypothetical protein BO94DRAFT_538347 [Aspergillus sclerotioniger CBS 115572]